MYPPVANFCSMCVPKIMKVGWQ